MEPAIIKCAGVEAEVALALPKSFASRRSILAEGGNITTSSADRVAAASLGLCWAHPKMRLRADLARCRFDLLAYGGEVLDELGIKGWDLDDVARAGMSCWFAIAESMTSTKPPAAGEAPKSLLDDVQETTDFSEPQKEAGTTSPA